MERRVVVWMVATAAFFFLYMSLRTLVGPPPQPPGAAPDDADPPAEVAADEARQPAADEPLEALAQGARPQRFTLGSMDPASGYHLLVTLNNRGGGIERIEMTERKENGRLRYRRTDTRSGYLGYLALSSDPAGNGCRVNVVGPGTPASTAVDEGSGAVGLRPGDLITAVGDRAVATPTDVQEALDRTEPDETLLVEILRGTAATAEAAPAEAAPAGGRDDGEGEETDAPGRGDEDDRQPPQDGGAERPDPAAEDEAVSPRAAAEGQRLRMRVELTEHPLDLVRLADTAGRNQIPGNLSRLSCLLGLQQVGGRKIAVGQQEIGGLPSQHDSLWQASAVDADAGLIEFRLPLAAEQTAAIGASGALELVRRYHLRPASDESDGYVLDMDVAVVNSGDRPERLAYRLEGPNGLTLEGWWYSTKISPNFGTAGARDVIYNTIAEGHELVGATKIVDHAANATSDPDFSLFAPSDSEPARSLRYIGVDAQYFTVSYLPPPGDDTTELFDRAAATLVADPARIDKHRRRAANTSFYVDSRPVEVAPGESLEHRLRLYAGPKQPDLLAGYGLAPAVEYGWFPWVAKPLSWLLHGFYMLVGNYALAIVLLTVMVRGCMFPLGRKAAQNAQKMQELAPELKKISEKYKDDMEKRLKAQQELQRKSGFNPLSGCLPMFLQLPIFIGLYRALSVDIELRQAPLTAASTWASNLAAPDMLYHWEPYLWEYIAGRGTGWLGPYFNILPVLVVGLFLAQQKMFMPPATDEQQMITQRVMTVMTVMMGLFFFKVPSGLCVYFITSSLWSVAERTWVKRTLPPPKTPTAAADTNGPAPASSKSTAGRLLDKAAGRQPPPETPKRRRRPPVSKKRR